MGSITFGPPREFVTALGRALDVHAFVETGTFEGETAIWASSEFASVYTVERSEPLYRRVEERLRPYGNVVCEYGDTRPFLSGILSRVPAAIFWLDAHWSGGETAGIEDECPLLDELWVLAPTLDRNIVLIDDARLFLAPPPPPHKAEHWPDVQQILAAAGGQPLFCEIVDDVIVLAAAKFADTLAPLIARHRRTGAAEAADPAGPPVTDPHSTIASLYAATLRLPSRKADDPEAENQPMAEVGRQIDLLTSAETIAKLSDEELLRCGRIARHFGIEGRARQFFERLWERDRGAAEARADLWTEISTQGDLADEPLLADRTTSYLLAALKMRLAQAGIRYYATCFHESGLGDQLMTGMATAKLAEMLGLQFAGIARERIPLGRIERMFDAQRSWYDIVFGDALPMVGDRHCVFYRLPDIGNLRDLLLHLHRDMHFAAEDGLRHTLGFFVGSQTGDDFRHGAQGGAPVAEVKHPV